MDGDTLSDRVRKRFHEFGRFFKGIVTSEKPTSASYSTDVRADHQVYDDVGKFGDNETLEFNARSQQPSIYFHQLPPERRSFSKLADPHDIFGSVRSVMEDFEQTMKIFDDFAFILQHPFHGQGPGGIPGMGIGLEPNQDTTIEEIEDEQDGRYSKFFGTRFPKSSIEVSDDNSAKKIPSAEENCRDLMLKPDPTERQTRGRNSTERHGQSLLGSILDSFWESPSTMEPSRVSPFGQDNYQNSSFFTFTSQESSIQSDVNGMSITATKIRETPEGREIITYQTNKNGVTEETREFIPRQDLPSTSNPTIGGIFRPRL